jgi:hypothetical protein
MPRLVKDVVNEAIVKFDSQNIEMKQFIIQLGNTVISQAEKIESLEKEIADYKDSMKKLLSVDSSQQGNAIIFPNGGK